MQARGYQTKAVELLGQYIAKNPLKHPCLSLATGAGKSFIIADIVRRRAKKVPDSKVLMVTCRRELVEQNYEKLKAITQDLDHGIYCAGLGKRELRQITYGTINSVHNIVGIEWFPDIVIVDEAHHIPINDASMYRKMIARIQEGAPNLIVIGLTATPYSTGHGYITEVSDPLFSEIIAPISMSELTEQGYLAPLKIVKTYAEFNADGVPKGSKGDYNQKRLGEAATNDVDANREYMKEAIRLAGDRKKWLIFSCSIKHAEMLSEILNNEGIKATHVSSEDKKVSRKAKIDGFKSGEYKAIVNALLLTTGIDIPDIDVIVDLRPTLSEAQFEQMAGRGTRIKSHGGDCLYIDMVGNTIRHGIPGEIVPYKTKEAEKKNAEIKPKICPGCSAIFAGNKRKCPECERPAPRECWSCQSIQSVGSPCSACGEQESKPRVFGGDIYDSGGLHELQDANAMPSVSQSRNRMIKLRLVFKEGGTAMIYYPVWRIEQREPVWVGLKTLNDLLSWIKIPRLNHSVVEYENVLIQTCHLINEKISNRPGIHAAVNKKGDYYRLIGITEKQDGHQ